MIRFRDEYTREIGADLIVHRNEEAIAAGANPYTLGTQNCCGLLKTRSLLDALEEGGFDAAFGGARRDEEKSRAKERVYSFRDAAGQWDPKNQRPELWSLYNSRLRKGESIRVFPLSNWTELDIWLYLYAEKIPIVPLYFAKERPITIRGGALTFVHEEMKLFPGEKVEMMKVRMRSLGCAPCTGAMRSEADTLPKIIEELMTFRRSERENRAIDHDEEGSMEVKKREGLLLMSTHLVPPPTELAPGRSFEEFLDAHLGQEMLRFTTAGSVDDGKSTLIGRLLHDTKSVYEDQLLAVQKSRVNRAANGHVDFSLLTDGLKAEREQGITIDVAYRYFSTARRKFIIADTPGHEQYTRNMATGASDRRRCHHSDRREGLRQGWRPAATVSPPHLHRIAAWHSAHCCRGKQDGSCGLLAGKLRRNQPRLRSPMRAVGTFRRRDDSRERSGG